MILMSEILFQKLIELCKKSKNEVSGVLQAKLNDDKIYISDVTFDSSSLIKDCSPRHITYKTDEYIVKIIYDMTFGNSLIYIQFHTHPGNLDAPKLSEADLNNLKYIQALAQRVKKIKKFKAILVIEAIVTSTEIAFYTFNPNTNKLIRLPFYVNGIEQIPSTEKTAFQLFKDGFKRGFKK